MYRDINGDGIRSEVLIKQSVQEYSCIEQVDFGSDQEILINPKVTYINTFEGGTSGQVSVPSGFSVITVYVVSLGDSVVFLLCTYF